MSDIRFCIDIGAAGYKVTRFTKQSPIPDRSYRPENSEEFFFTTIVDAIEWTRIELVKLKNGGKPKIGPAPATKKKGGK